MLRAVRWEEKMWIAGLVAGSWLLHRATTDGRRKLDKFVALSFTLFLLVGVAPLAYGWQRLDAGEYLYQVQPDGQVRIYGSKLCLFQYDDGGPEHVFDQYALVKDTQDAFVRKLQAQMPRYRGWKPEQFDGSCGGTALVPGLHNIVGLAAGFRSLVAVDEQGYLWAWGYNRFGKMGFSSKRWLERPQKITALGKVKAFDANALYTLVLTESGIFGYGGRLTGCAITLQ